MATTSGTLWNAVVLRSGKETQDMLDTGVIVLFGEPVPDALSDICVVHNRDGRSPMSPKRQIVPGDVLNLAGTRYTIDEVGEVATSNLGDLGHVVLYFNSPDQSLLAGAIKVSGPKPQVPDQGAILAIEPAE
ncbi:PTS glucitol/sorbitol transporter subunit IIA [Cutibacterium equinum]|uniref:PTS glucitol/sorbitol transporter subunit IIA n=1 Tax=Cutibacterium equinum TaxID=3016342 RepID=A0ABY7R168_9ACTN|nr:PTS glucitol/sorbitol transporter subunit IIA [Cutibacterium equinum]WCC80267.1 PTS glucitol/sorbitol transporter subunit IIA [Cutibacterium equinum]